MKPLLKHLALAGLLTVLARPSIAATEESLNKSFSVAPGGRLVVEVDFGAIEVSTNSADAVVVDVFRKVTLRSAEKEQEFLKERPVTFQQDGNTVTVRARKAGKNSLWNGGWSNSRVEGRYTIRVPARFDVVLQTAGGGVTVSDLTGSTKADTSGGRLKFQRLRGPLKGDTSGGGITVTDCEGDLVVDTSGGGIEVAGGGGSLKADTSGGSITVKNFRGPATVDTSGGGITIERVAGRIKGATSGGSVKAVLLAPITEDVSLETSGGGISVSVPGEAAFNLEAETSAGGVKCDLPVEVSGKRHHDSLKGPVNGGGKRVRLHTSAGGIHVRKLD